MSKSTKSFKYSIFALLLVGIILLCYGFVYWNYIKIQNENVKSSISQGSTLLQPVGKRAEIKIAPPIEVAKAVAMSSNRKIYDIPALIYHKTPDNFEQQLIALRDKGYTTITMSELNEIIRGRTAGPAKPVAITFDDGFSDQLRAFDLLKKYNMKALSL